MLWKLECVVFRGVVSIGGRHGLCSSGIRCVCQIVWGVWVSKILGCSFGSFGETIVAADK